MPAPLPGSGRRIGLIILALAVVHTWDRTASADPLPEVRLKDINYHDFGEVVKAQRGKVVVVDVWADFCAPCKREFPNLVRLHERYAADGLVCISVTVDKAEQHTAALVFLTRMKATFANYRLTDPVEVWQKAWKINGPPAVFVFDRNGKRAARFDGEDEKKPFTYENAQVEALVRKLLRPGS
jgi:thiol-disulfide isomerase/thioredoxin